MLGVVAEAGQLMTSARKGPEPLDLPTYADQRLFASD